MNFLDINITSVFLNFLIDLNIPKYESDLNVPSVIFLNFNVSQFNVIFNVPQYKFDFHCTWIPVQPSFSSFSEMSK